MNSRSKRFGHKIYTNDGTYIETLPRDLVTNTPSFNWQMNGGMGEMVIKLALSIRDFSSGYENTIIKLGNRVKTIVTDANTTVPIKIYSGYITAYEPTMDEDGKQEVTVHVTSSLKVLADNLFHDGAATTKAYASEDPSNIMKNVIDKCASVIHYAGASIALTTTTVSYTMNYLTYREAVDIVLGLCPAYWYWYVDADDLFYLKPANFDTIDHKLFIGKQVNSIKASKSIEELYNAVYFKGGGDPAMYKLYSRSSSITEYGRREYKMQDERVTTAATASTMATKFLDEHDHPRSVLTATVMDDAVDSGKGYDIESLRPGQVVQIKHPRIEDKITLWDIADWDIDFWDFNLIYSLSLPMQLVSVDYQYDRAIIQLSLVPTDVAHRIEDINRNLDTSRAETVPSTPS